MSSACTCHINPETCWWCLYEKEKEKSQRYEKALRKIDEQLQQAIEMWGNAEKVCYECKEIVKSVLKEEEK